ncbi:NAD(P)H-hydrate epimerase [Candidatus Margulisiibacteriota bacterium]
MKKSLSIAEAQAFDKAAQEKLGIPSLVLMENAGRGVAEEAVKMVRWKDGEQVAIVCGTGNNGGDGLVAARHLLNAGTKVKVYLLGDESKLKPDPQTNLSILKKMGQEVYKDLAGLEQADLIIDAIFGIGLKSDVRSPMSNVIDLLNSSGKPILAVDVPSGLDADTGEVLGRAIKAKKTITFVAAKNGFYLNRGPEHCGEIVLQRHLW